MGGNTSSICKIEARKAIDQALIAGESNRAIASQYGLSHAAVGRRRQNHLSATLVKSAESREMATGRSFWTVLTGLWTKLWLPWSELRPKLMSGRVKAVSGKRGIL